ARDGARLAAAPSEHRGSTACADSCRRAYSCPATSVCRRWTLAWEPTPSRPPLAARWQSFGHPLSSPPAPWRSTPPGPAALPAAGWLRCPYASVESPAPTLPLADPVVANAHAGAPATAARYRASRCRRLPASPAGAWRYG